MRFSEGDKFAEFYPGTSLPQLHARQGRMLFMTAQGRP